MGTVTCGTDELVAHTASLTRLGPGRDKDLRASSQSGRCSSKHRQGREVSGPGEGRAASTGHESKHGAGVGDRAASPLRPPESQ